MPLPWRPSTPPPRPATAALALRRLLPLLLLLAVPATADGDALREQTRQLVEDQDVEAIHALGPAVLEPLVELYRDASVAQRAALAWIFYKLGWPSELALEALLEDARSRDRDLRIAVQYALGRVSASDVVVNVLFENMRQGESWLFRDKAACSLAYDQIHLDERQRYRLYHRLIDALGDPSGELRDLAIRVLEVHTGQRKGFDALASESDRRLAIEQWWRWLAEYRIEALAAP